MSFIQNSWPQPEYLKKVSSYNKLKTVKKTQRVPVFFAHKSGMANNYTEFNVTTQIIDRSPAKYATDQLCVCIMMWWFILGGIKNFFIQMFNQNGTRY